MTPENDSSQPGRRIEWAFSHRLSPRLAGILAFIAQRQGRGRDGPFWTSYPTLVDTFAGLKRSAAKNALLELEGMGLLRGDRVGRKTTRYVCTWGEVSGNRDTKQQGVRESGCEVSGNPAARCPGNETLRSSRETDKEDSSSSTPRPPKPVRHEDEEVLLQKDEGESWSDYAARAIESYGRNRSAWWRKSLLIWATTKMGTPNPRTLHKCAQGWQAPSEEMEMF